jgi:hypothetical protein
MLQMKPNVVALGVIIIIASFPVICGLFIGLPFQQLYAVNDYKYHADNDETSIQDKVRQDNIGGGRSTNFNCGGQLIAGEVPVECHSAADGDGADRADGDGADRAFTIIVVANEGEILCEPPLPPGDSFLAAIAVRDGTVTGNYTITHIGMVTQQRTGDISTADTDGNRYSINAENLGFCSDLTGEITISGECGEDVIIRYEDPSAVGTFTGDVECTLST